MNGFFLSFFSFIFFDMISYEFHLGLVRCHDILDYSANRVTGLASAYVVKVSLPAEAKLVPGIEIVFLRLLSPSDIL